VAEVAQFDTHANPSAAQREVFPYVVVIQHDQLARYSTRLVMPLSRMPSPPKGQPHRLSQSVEVKGERLWLAPHLCAAVPTRVLGRVVASLRAERGRFVDALDAVVSGV
jgi:toxin CcdB